MGWGAAPSPNAAALSPAEFAALMAPLGPFGSAPALTVAVSGGPHSLALAWLAARWVQARGGDLQALVVDHGLRAGSAAEAAGVAATLASIGIPALMLRLALPGGSAIQARARAARLAALLEACRNAGRPWLLLGHHRADQAETLLLRALAGSAAMGLAGMSAVRPAESALLLRPLLGIPPARLEATLAAAGLRPVRDPSNADPRFARVRLRQVLEQAGEPATAALADATARFAGRRAAHAAPLAARLAVAARLYPLGCADVDLAALGTDATAVAAMAGLIRVVGGSAFAPPAAAVAALLARGVGTLGGARLLPGSIGRLLREPGAVAPAVAARHGASWDGRFRLLGRGDPEAQLGALGPPQAALRRRAPAWPAALLSTLPAIRRNGTLCAVPGLLYPSQEACADFAVVFSPAAGPASG